MNVETRFKEYLKQEREMIRRQWRRIAASATAPRKPSTAPIWMLWGVGILIGGGKGEQP